MDEQERGSCETQQRSGSQKHRRMLNLLGAGYLFVLGELRQVPALREGNQDGICFSFVLVVRAKRRTQSPSLDAHDGVRLWIEGRTAAEHLHTDDGLLDLAAASLKC